MAAEEEVVGSAAAAAEVAAAADSATEAEEEVAVSTEVDVRPTSPPSRVIFFVFDYLSI